jgi:hypothetical protein
MPLEEKLPGVTVNFIPPGGDGPEAIADALDAVLKLSWRPEAVKMCVLIADAPPHGLGTAGDGFPNGKAICVQKSLCENI